MKNIDNKAFIEIQNIILEHDYRELSLLSRIMNNFYIKESAEMILENINKGKIIISTGFFEIIPKTIETDGPPGAFSIGNAITKLGGEIIYLIESHTKDFIGKDQKTIVFPNTTKEKSVEFAKTIIKDYKPSALISIERCGITENNRYLNISRQDISNYNAYIDVLFDLHNNTIGIGDGGNEIGMGNLHDQIVDISGLPDNPSTTTVSHLIISSCSNWGSYGLIAAISKIVGKNLLPSVEQGKKYIRKLVDNGAVEGMSGKKYYGVDGRNLDDDSVCLQRLHDNLKNYGL